MEMFEKASRMKLRFPHKGSCSVEDLWDVPLSGLDTIFKQLNAKLKTEKEESLLEKQSEADTVSGLQIAIVKHIFTVRQEEARIKEDAAARAQRKQKLLGIIAEKQDASLHNMSIDELTKAVNEL